MEKSACEVFHPSFDCTEGFLHLTQVLFTCVVPLLLSLQALFPLHHLQVTGKEKGTSSYRAFATTTSTTYLET